MKCGKVKNPCKICFQSVSKKNGLQCQGACQKWAHYKCLNYTPGKIQDIKAGLIEVTCPCPDCNTSSPKEKLVDPPFTCTNTQCPANKLPICSSVECPSNENPIPMYPPPPFEYSPPRSTTRSSSPHRPSKCCVNKKSSPPNFNTKYKKSTKCDAHTSNHSTSANPPKCPPACPSQQLLSKPKKKSCTPKLSKSCSNLSNNSSCIGKGQFENLRTISSDSQVPNIGVDQKMLYTAIENLCNTVGQLSNQLKDLMCKMKQNLA